MNIYLYNIMLTKMVCCHGRTQAAYIKENRYVVKGPIFVLIIDVRQVVLRPLPNSGG